MMNINDALNLLNITATATQAEIKKAYKAASIQFHPDRNPAGAQMMIAINAAYAFLKQQGDTVSPQEGFTANNYGEELNTILNQLFALDGLEIEVCGNWVWIGGNTKAHKETLGKNGLGCLWANKKKMWYYRPSDYKSRGGRGGWDMDTIRGVHGSEKPTRTAQRQLAA
ncbi:J domain-containing protein [Vibrio ordalii]|uniref:J domain-containing protein n=1 Tax=Vibrio ordalii TaxID=28174 RepID=UPI000305C9CD|nr:J domain-containing protein [Vibrio ordalii]